MTVSRQDYHLDMSELRGPRARTRRLMLTTAVQLMQSGATPSVSAVAEVAEVSRATAYRYFPSQAALVRAVVEAALGPILLWESSSNDAEERLADLLASSMPRLEDFEATFRAALKLSLDQWARSQAGTFGTEPVLQRGHRLALLNEAIAPLKDELSAQQLERLSHALALVFGVEFIVVMKDICGLEGEELNQLSVWMAHSLVRSAVAESTVRKKGIPKSRKSKRGT